MNEVFVIQTDYFSNSQLPCHVFEINEYTIQYNTFPGFLWEEIVVAMALL